FQGRWHFNTSIAAIMEFVNELYSVEAELTKQENLDRLAHALQNLVLLLAPYAPYLANELWEAITPDRMGEISIPRPNLLRHSWPLFDAALAKEDEITYPVQINGKLRSH